MAKIVLFFPNPFSATRDYSGVPLSLLGISRILDSEGYPIKVVTPHEFRDYPQEVLRHIDDAICLGISAMTGFQIKDGLDVADLVKRKKPALPIVWGGWHPSILPEETVKDPRVDYVVIGQGERTFTELVHALEKNQPVDGVPGIAFTRNGRAVTTGVRLPESLDNFPPIPYHLIDVEKYMASSEFGNRCVAYYSSYGCPHRCGFCVEKGVNKRRWVSESAERTVASMEHLAERYQVDGVFMHDSNLFVDRKRVEKICDLIKQKRLAINWGCAGGRSDQLSRYDADTWKRLEEGHCKTILLGAESGSQDTLDFLNKDITLEQTVKVAEMSAKYAIKLFPSFLVGLPWSKDARECQRRVRDEFRSTLSFMDRLLNINPRLRIMFFVYLPYPSADLFNRAANLGLDLPNSLSGWSDYLMAAEDVTKIVQRQKWISKAQMARVLMISSYIFFFLDDDSIDYVRLRVKNPVMRFAGMLVFRAFRCVAKFRWKLKWFRLPLDFYAYNLLRKYANIG